MIVDIVFPMGSWTIAEATITKWFKSPGDSVIKGEAICEIETDKAAMEIESPVSGKLSSIIASESAVIKPLEVIGTVDTDEEQSVGIKVEELLISNEISNVAHSNNSISSHQVIFASPIAKRRARELGIDINQIRGSGPNGRIIENDVLEFSKVKSEQNPFESRSEEKDILEPLSKVKLTTGMKMVQSKAEAPHFYLSIETDATSLEILRNEYNQTRLEKTRENLSITSILIKLTALALQKNPNINVRYENGQIRKLSDINIGIAISSTEGLIVPVIHNAAQKDLTEISYELGQYKIKAKEGGLAFSVDNLTGGTFTISNLGMFGIDNFCAIINPPESAILAVGRINRKFIVEGDSIKIKPMINLTLSVDHRVIDGVEAANFLNYLSKFEFVDEKNLKTEEHDP